MAVQLTATNGPSQRGELKWIILAMTSLPAPVGPRMSVLIGLWAMVRASWTMLRMASHWPMIFLVW